MSRKLETLKQILAPVVESMGFEFWGVEYLQGKQTVLRVYIEHENGIHVDDCAAVSHQLSGVLDVEDPISGEYSLEVSSPGLERPLYTLEQWQRFAGEQAQLRLLAPVNGRRKLVAEIKGVEQDQVLLEFEGETVAVDLDQIDRANLAYDFSK